MDKCQTVKITHITFTRHDINLTSLQLHYISTQVAFLCSVAGTEAIIKIAGKTLHITLVLCCIGKIQVVIKEFKNHIREN